MTISSGADDAIGGPLFALNFRKALRLRWKRFACPFSNVGFSRPIGYQISTTVYLVKKNIHACIFFFDPLCFGLARVSEASEEMPAESRTRGRGRLSAEGTAELEERLLDAAEATFLEQGYQRATIDSIAKAADITRKTLYARYANKNEIFEAAVRRMLDAGLSFPLVEARGKGERPRRLLLNLARDLIALHETPHMVRIYRLIFAEGQQMPDLARMSAELYDRQAETVAAVMEMLRATGQFPRMPSPRIAAVMFLELVSSTARLRALAGPGAALPKAKADRYVVEAVDFFLVGCGYAEGGNQAPGAR
jgi:TetR/AcrR family transcriptional regulator, mexJK operon transcriptional repressor